LYLYPGFPLSVVFYGAQHKIRTYLEIFFIILNSFNITKDGKKVSDPGIIQLQIFTPSHYMWLDKKNGDFYTAMLCSYTKEGNKINIIPIIASFPLDEKEKVDITATVKGNQMITIVNRITN
jgi:hypothetical protein